MYKYYNPERKEQYIKDRYANATLPNKSLENVFSKIRFYEEMKDKDACDFSVDEILDLYKILDFTAVDSINVFNNHLSMYAQWCLQENLVVDCQDHYSELTSTVLREQINKFYFDKRFVTREMLIRWKDQVPNAMDAFLLFCLFEGICGKDYVEISNLKKSDFNGTTVTLCTGRTIEVSPMLVALAAEADAELEYIPLSGNKRFLTLKDEETIFKNFKNAKEESTDRRMGRRIYRRVISILKYLGAETSISANSIVESGKLDFIARESKKLGLTRLEYLRSEHVEDYLHQFNTTLIYSRFVNKFNEFFNEDME